jgi:hypothetical protein
VSHIGETIVKPLPRLRLSVENPGSTTTLPASVGVFTCDHWTITTIHPDHSVTLTGRTGTIRLPAEYVAEDLEPGYAQTSHATQGRTVDTALLLLDTPTDIRGVYTPMTRGRQSNHAYVVVDENQTAHDVLTQAITRDWIDQPAMVRKAQLEMPQPVPPRWQSLQAHHDTVAEPGRVAEPDQDPTHSHSAGDDERKAEERRIRQLTDERLAAIQQRRRTIGRDQPTISR